MNLNTPATGKLTAADLVTASEWYPHADFPQALAAAVAANRANPAGCDQQGRQQARTWAGSEQPIAAEASTDEGAEPDPRAKRRFWTLYLAALLVSVIVGAASLAGCATQVATAAVPVAAPMGDPVDYPGRWFYVLDRECPTWRDCT